MKNIINIGLGAVMAAFAMTSCGDYEPRGYEQVPDLPKASNLKATVGAKHAVDVTWTLPSAPAGMEISDVQFILNANTGNPVSLGPTATSYKVQGAMWNEESVFTVKVCYDERYISEGTSIVYEMPYEALPSVSDLKMEQKGRRVYLTWKNPAGNTGVRILRNGEVVMTLPAEATSVKLTAQPMDQDLTYTVEPLFDTYYPGVGKSVATKIPYIESKIAMLLLSDVDDDDELAAKNWFAAQGDGFVFVGADKINTLDPDAYSVVWISIDRVGLPLGWENLPAEVSSPAAIAALKAYTAEGGSLYLSNMATQLTVPLGIVPDTMAPTVFGNGNGGQGNDIWTINPQLGVDFRNGGAQGYYDRSAHEIFAGLEMMEEPNGWTGMIGLPMIGPGVREDHNCLWDCNLYGKGDFKDVIENFENTTNSMVLATWGHVRDHCVAVLVDFSATADHGRCVAMGAAAYEWNQNSNPNEYQANIERLTLNILNYLK